MKFQCPECYLLVDVDTGSGILNDFVLTLEAACPHCEWAGYAIFYYSHMEKME